MVARVRLHTMPAAFVLPLLLGAHAAAAVAGPLPDPTRPPPEIIGAYGSEGQPAEQAAAQGSRGLQMVIIALKRRAAIIDGHTLEVGEKYGDATLVEVREGAALLRDAQGKQILLTMFPTVAITRQAAPVARGHKAKIDNTEQERGNGAAPKVAPREGK